MARTSDSTDSPTVVAIVNTNPDLVRMLQIALERAGFVVLILHIEDLRLGASNFDAMLAQHDPRVIVYDVAPPYEQNWRFLAHLRNKTDFGGRQFVLTSVNVKRLQQVVGKDERVYEVVGDNRDLNQIVRAVKEASRARAIR